jgi:L-asparagine oxygenase
MHEIADTAVVDSPHLELDPADAAEVDQLARHLCAGGQDRVDAPEWVARARDGWDELPLPLRRGVHRFRRDSGPRGVLVIHGLPVDEAMLPATPSAQDSVQREATVSAAVLTMVACGLGDPAAYSAEKFGALVQDVVPVRGKETFSGNAGSVLLTFHNENAFHQHEPDYVLLLCLRADHDRIAGLRTACIREVLPLLTAASREALFAPEFILAPPPSFPSDDAARSPQPLLSGAAAMPLTLIVTADQVAMAAAGGAGRSGRGGSASGRAVSTQNVIFVRGGRGFLTGSVWRGKRRPGRRCSRRKDLVRRIWGSRWRGSVIS